MDNKMPSTAKSCKEDKKLLKEKEKFMKLKGYRIKVGEDTFILFKNEAFYLQMLYLEKVVFDIHKQLFNRKEVISLIFRLKTLRIYLKYFMKHYRSIKINVFYDRSKYENPLKIKFPHLTCCVDNDRKEEIEDEIFNYENEQLEDTYFKIIYWVIDAIDVKYTKKIELKIIFFLIMILFLFVILILILLLILIMILIVIMILIMNMILIIILIVFMILIMIMIMIKIKILKLFILIVLLKIDRMIVNVLKFKKNPSLLLS